MKARGIAITGVAMAVALTMAPAYAASPNLEKASELLGMKVESGQGDKLGKVSELVLDTTHSQVGYAVLEFDEGVGAREKLFAIPWNAINLSGDTVRLNVTKDQLSEAEGFDDDNWPDMANPRWSSHIHRFFHVDPVVRVYFYDTEPEYRAIQPRGETSEFYERGYDREVQEPRYRYDRNEREPVGRYDNWEDTEELRNRYDTGRYPGYRHYRPYSLYREEGERVRGWSNNPDRDDYHVEQQPYSSSTGARNPQYDYRMSERGFDARAREDYDTRGENIRQRDRYDQRSMSDDDYGYEGYYGYGYGSREGRYDEDAGDDWYEGQERRTVDRNLYKGEHYEYSRGDRDDFWEERFELRKLSELIGMEVQNHDDENLGDIEDFVIDMNSGRVEYALLGFGGLFGLSTQTAAIPWSALDVRAGERIAMLDTTEDVLKAVAVDEVRIADLEQPERARDLHARFGQTYDIYAYESERPEGVMRSRTPGRITDSAWGANSTYSQQFKADAMTSFSGTITTVGTFTPEAGAEPGLRMRVRDERGQTWTVHAGPRQFARDQGINFSSGDSVTVNGSQTTFHGRSVLMATQIRKGEQQLNLRGADGSPRWTQ